MTAKPRIVAPLDTGFLPAALFNRNYAAAAQASGEAVPLVIGLEREHGLLSRYETVVRPDAGPDTVRYVERLVKFLLWSRGGWKLWLGGPRDLGVRIQHAYNASGERRFDAGLMSRIYERPFEVIPTKAEAVPDEKETSRSLGGHLDGCRIGFDLGASDYKVAALKEGAVVYSGEFPWNPKDQSDPQYHYGHINSGLRTAAGHLPRVDAIGGSSAGVIVENKIRVASLLRSVPPARFGKARNLFLRLRDEWKVPFEVANDGDVAALAGAMSLKANGLLGVAMGSSEAAGYLNPQGAMTGWLNELAFAPVDYNPNAAADEWSGDRGVGVTYFSQQVLNRLLPAADWPFPADTGLPDRLKRVQERMDVGDGRAGRIYETIGVYLGYTIALYASFYDFRHALVLGRLTSGSGGHLVLDQARRVLAQEFPAIAAGIQLHVPDEKSRRVGQAIAAATLPGISR